MLKILGSTIFAAALAVVGAQAADLPVKAPLYNLPPAGFSWSGIYLGAEVGAAISAIQLDSTGSNSTLGTITNPGSIGPNAAGVVGGLNFGLRYQPGGNPFVFGLEFGADLTGLNSSSNPDVGQTLLAVAATGLSAPAGSTSIPWDARVGAELGYSVMPTFMLFVDGGLAFGEIKTNVTAVNFNAAAINQATIVANTDNVHTGFFVGAGFDWAFTPNLVLEGKWRFTDLGTQGVTFNGTGAAAASTFNIKDHASYNAFLLGLKWKI
jgi:outer membrane immunogenic protein